MLDKDPSAGDMLICVDVLDREVGQATKLACHSGTGILHRAFSVFLWRRDEQGKVELLLQRRAAGKYHSGGLWTNSCCSHPRVGENLDEAVERRLLQELGVSGVDCHEVGSFVYHSSYEGGVSEFEFDHVFVGEYAGEVDPDPSEADATAWVDAGTLMADLAADPAKYTTWFTTAAPMAISHLTEQAS